MANKTYGVIETAIAWADSGGDAVLTLTSVASGAGRQGALYDLGATARAHLYTWRAWVQFATTPVVGERVEVYLKTAQASNAHPDNDDGTGDAAVSAEDKLRNLRHLGSIVVDETSTTPEFVASGGPIWVSEQVVAPVFWNRTADALSATAADHGFELVPVPQELQ